jgi:hypothetical protein
MMSGVVALCTQLLLIQLNAATTGLPVLKQDAFTCVLARLKKKPSEFLTRLFLHSLRKMLNCGESSMCI